MKILPPAFFKRTAPEIALDILGAHLLRRHKGVTTKYRIIEVEAYDGFEDAASHASKGKTKRTEVMYGPPGHWYVYLVYGMYEMLNIVTGNEGYPSAVLIRGVESAHRRIDGPGKVTRELYIDRSLNTLVATKETGLWIEKGEPVSHSKIVQTPRIGVAYAGEWAKKEWRFLIQD